MGPDFYDSSKLSLILSWAANLLDSGVFVSLLVQAYKKHDGVPWLCTAWISTAYLYFGPARYLTFLLVTATSYPFQSVNAFFSVLWVWPWIPALIAFSLLVALGVYFPLFATAWTLRFGKIGIVISAILAPVAAYLSSLIFFTVLPFAGISAYFLDPDAIVRATNGPARIAFLANGPQALPPYFSKTPETYTDMVRSHVALMYLNKQNHDRFLKIEYPYLYDEFHEVVIKKLY